MKTAKWSSLEFECSDRLDPQHVGVILDFVATLTKSQSPPFSQFTRNRCTFMFQWITKSRSRFGAYGIDLAARVLVAIHDEDLNYMICPVSVLI
jgi:hypothetical protein